MFVDMIVAPVEHSGRCFLGGPSPSEEMYAVILALTYVSVSSVYSISGPA